MLSFVFLEPVRWLSVMALCFLDVAPYDRFADGRVMIGLAARSWRLA